MFEFGGSDGLGQAGRHPEPIEAIAGAIVSAGQRNDWNRRVVLPDCSNVAQDIKMLEVRSKEDQVGRTAPQCVEQLRDRGGRHDLVRVIVLEVLHVAPHEVYFGGIVIDDEHPRVAGCGAAMPDSVTGRHTFSRRGQQSDCAHTNNAPRAGLCGTGAVSHRRALTRLQFSLADAFSAVNDLEERHSGTSRGGTATESTRPAGHVLHLIVWLVPARSPQHLWPWPRRRIGDKEVRSEGV